MPEVWLNFIIVIFTQLILFVVCGWYTKKLSNLPSILGRGFLIAIVIGIPFDLIMGKLFGLHSFYLGFGILFLIVNSALSYGLFASNILLLQHVRLPHFILWNIIVVAVYEIINNFFPVWKWGFVLSSAKFVMILLVGYLGGAIFVVLISHILLGRRFLLIDNLFKK